MLCIRFLIRSMHSSTKKTDPILQTKMKFKALWAQKITNTLASKHILNHDGCLIYYIQTLELQKHLISQNQKAVVEQAKKQVMRMFEIGEGIQLPKKLLQTQQRFQRALNLNRKMTFYPNKIVTQIIFENIQQVSIFKIKKMIVGKPGISKSINFILAWKLSQIVCQFRYKYPQQAEKMIKNKQLDQEYKKIIYVNFKYQNYQQYFQSLIVQCPQFTQQLSQIYKQYKKQSEKTSPQKTNPLFQNYFQRILKVIINRYIQKNIECLTVMDQINTVASAIKIASMELSKSRDNPTPIQNSQQAFTQAFRYYKIFMLIFLNMGRFICNSSTNIEKQILGSRSIQYPLALNLNHHTPIQIIECSFNQNSYKFFYKQLYYFFLYEIEKRLLCPSNQQINQIQKQKNKQNYNRHIKYKIQNILIKLSKQNKFVSYITPYSISIAVSENFQQILKKLTKDEIKQDLLQIELRQLVKKTIKIGKEFILYKIKKFIEIDPQQQQNKIAILTACCVKLKENQQRQFFMSFSQIKQFINLYNKNISNPKPYPQLSYLIGNDNDIFELYGPENLRLKIPKNQFQQIVKNYIISIPNYVPYIFILLIQKNCTSALETLLEACILDFIEKNQNCIIQMGGISYKLIKKINFLHFLVKEVQNSQRFIDILNISLQQQTYYGFPINSKGKHFSNNPSLDLLHALVKQNKLYLRSFDFTLAREKSDLNSKVQDAYSQLKRKIYDVILKWEHVILCRPKFAKNKCKVEQQKFSIIFEDITDIEITLGQQKLSREQKQVVASINKTIKYVKQTDLKQ